MSKDLELRINKWDEGALYPEPTMTEVNTASYRHIEVVDGVYDAFERKAVEYARMESQEYGAN